MASPLSRKRKSPETDHDAHNVSWTPAGSPPRKKLRITQSQKQALIDNLQLESKLVLPPAKSVRFHPLTERAADDRKSPSEPANCARNMLSRPRTFEHGLNDV